MSDHDSRFMRYALGLGRRGLGLTWPNPAVGCVIVKEGRIVGTGYTAPSGRPHAETQALSQAGELAAGSTVYVTLEPCAHYGQTPPCAQALIDARVARVVIALGDPDPRVDGGGVAMLRAAGLDVTMGVLSDEAQQDHAGFLKRVTHGAPLVTLKLATSLDGRIATASGESQWITGPLARRFVHAERMRHDAVMVGAGTARQDDPSLTVRDMGDLRQPVRVVVSGKLDVPNASKLRDTMDQAPLWLVHGPSAPDERQAYWQEQGAKLIEVPFKYGQVDMGATLQALGAAGLTRVYCEGGGTLAATLLAADLVDALTLYSAGLALGAEGWPAIGALGAESLAAAPRFEHVATQMIGPDTVRYLRRRARQSKGSETAQP